MDHTTEPCDRPSDPRPAGARLRDRLRTVDPALARAMTALRAIVAATLAATATAGPLVLLERGLAPVGLAVLVGLFGVVVAPPGPPRAFLPVVGGAAAVAGVLAAVVPGPQGGWLLALAATGVGAWLGRWGPIGRAAGFVTFVCVVLGLRLELGPDDAIATALAVPIAVAAVVVTLRFVLPARPARRAGRLVRDLVAQVSLLMDATEELVSNGPGDRRQRRLRRRLVAAQEMATLLDASLDELDARQDGDAAGGREGSGTGTTDLRRALLDVEALADHVAWIALTVPASATTEERARMVTLLRRGRTAARGPDAREISRGPLVPRLTGHDDRLDEVVPRLDAAALRLEAAAQHVPVRTGGPRPWGTEQPTAVSRVVVQALVAGAGALGFGLLVSRDEWHWSLIGAFIVVTTTASRGAGVRKAAERIIGTAVGVVAGLGAAAALAGRGPLLIALLVTLAAMIWVFSRSYVLFMFALTIAVALLYEVLGVLTTQVLALRLAETALGAAFAALVVSVVLPVPTRRTVDGAVTVVLQALDDALDHLATVGRVGGVQVRAVDRAVSALREAVAPVAEGVPGGGGTRVRAARLLATALRVRVTALATATASDRLRDTDRHALDVVRDRLRLLLLHLDGWGLTSDDPPPFPDGAGDVHDVLRAIDDRLAGYGTSRGIALRQDPGSLAAGSQHRRD